MKLPDSDLQNIMSLGIDRNTESDSATSLTEVLNIKCFFGFERKEQVDDTPIEHIPIVYWEYLSKMERKLEDLSSDDTLSNHENEESYQKGGEPRTQEEKVESPTQSEFTEVPLTHSQDPISEWLDDTSLQIFVIRVIDGTYSTFREITEANALPIAELKLLSLLPMLVETEKGKELSKKIRRSLWSVIGQEEVAPVSSYIPIIYWEYLNGTSTYELLRTDGSREMFNTSKLLCLDETSLQPLINKEMNEMAFGIERAIKAFAKR
ncbi:hypothetical protein L1987_18194 [Smallanthus sonchifolius]|uniref:Uncharacterized protein n=1 Tax=Smallanthus sonchifolius TaxID=185202 RepID=A0ACB9IZX9_9ASTR|nr:hypothetical protein L1987_18194 [Smallanthus sonchifolius]